MPVGVSCTDLDAARRHLARIRCLNACVRCLETNAPLPAPLAYVPATLRYGAERNTKVVVQARPARSSRVLVEFICSPEHVVIVGGEELCNTEGRWARFIKASVKGGAEQAVPDSPDRWVLLFSHDLAITELLTPLKGPVGGQSPDSTALHRPTIDNWMDVVEHEYALRLTHACVPAQPDAEAVARLRALAPRWTLEQDEDLAQFLGKHVDPGASSLGSIKDYVDSIDVSSKSHGYGEENLTDNDSTTFWESDGSHGSHWIRLRMKKGVVIKKLCLTVGGGDSNYMPQLIHVMGGDTVDNLKKINDVTIDQSVSEIADVVILAEQTEFFPIIEIRIKECKDHGIDTRIRGIKIKSCRDGDVGINRDLFMRCNLVRFPKLETFEQDVIYRRALILERMMKLLDSVLVYMVPLWDYSAASYASINTIRQLLPLSVKRMNLVDQFLGKTELSAAQIPKLYINRRAALEHRADPGQDPEATNSVFTQIYEGLKPKDLHQSPQHYRWSTRHDQWWECKFFSEGVIDQGGGFRDSISDLSEELCPSGCDDPVPLPFFIRSPNQKNDDASNYRDAYVPNPSCTEFHKYEWIGKLMGACLRGKEFLVLSLPSYFWKRLSGQPISWAKDFITVDEYQVKSLETLAAMDEASFAAYFSGRARTWTVTLSDGTCAALKPDGATLEVSYADRLEYIRLVQEARLNESKKQIEAIQRGLLMVVPQAVLELLTCQELDRRICGDPEITVEALRRHIHFEDYQKEDARVKFLWATLENFSNEDRSRLIRFVTGRRRLPANMHIFWGDGSQDALPTSSTCGSALFLPNYSSAKIMEEKLRYAMYNCVSIDTDTMPLDDY